MLWALDEKEKKIEAVPGKDGTCPLCKGKVFSKCGEVNVWHWAHFKAGNCDSWYEPETHWHLHWKMTFGKENTEVVIKKNEKRHIADVLTSKGVVIELQNSPIQKSIIREREIFYGEKMLWIVNGIQFAHNFRIWEYTREEINVNIDYSDRNRHFRPRDESQNEIGIGEKSFSWSYARRSWKDVKRPVFIDFGEDLLFWIRGGMGNSKGRGDFVSKEKFIKKYGGNFEYYSRQKKSDFSGKGSSN